jgi:sulfur carrier protein
MGAEMVQRHRPFEPDADSTAVGKHDKNGDRETFCQACPPWGRPFLMGPDSERRMDILLNGEKTQLSAKATIGDLIREKGLDPATVVVELNRQIISTADIDGVTLNPDDALEILRFVGGG